MSVSRWYTFSRVKNEILNDLVIIMTSKTLLVWNLGSVQVWRFWPKRSIFFFFLHILIFNDQTVVTSTMLNKISITLDLQLFREAFWLLNLVVIEEVLWFCTPFVLYGFTNYFTETIYIKPAKDCQILCSQFLRPSSPDCIFNVKSNLGQLQTCLSILKISHWYDKLFLKTLAA